MSENLRIDELYSYVKKVHEARKISDEFRNDEGKLASMLSKLDSSLLVKLRSYQEDAVKWMLRRELATPAESSSDAEQFVFDGFNVIYPKGGILADEMGLGKTIEVLACILSHPYASDSEAFIQEDSFEMNETAVESELNRKTDTLAKRMAEKIKGQGKKRKHSKLKEKLDEGEIAKKKKTGINSEKYASLRALYAQHTSSICQVNVCEDNSGSLRCFCDRNPDIDDVISCEKCHSSQHLICVGSPATEEEYVCPWCWTKEPPVKSGSTLIVSPNTISSQWIDEINRHVNSSSLKVLFYEGVKGRKYIQPKDLAEYDIVITTYQVLSVELSYVSGEEGTTRRLRHAKKYHAPVTPLTCVEWWRLCLDEAQMVEGSTTKTASMACQLQAVHKWAVTGTPIQKTISDLYGLIKFLGIVPFTNQAEWFRLLDDEEKCYRFLAPILWRSIKNDVFDQIGVPPQTVLSHWLRFSPVEGYFYQRIHTECADLFKQRITKLINPAQVRIKDIDRSRLNKFLMPLLKLRQACIHPQVIRGKYVKFKHTMTMEELMIDMVAKAKVDLSNALRAVVSSLNGIAGINWIDYNYSATIECYRRILQIANNYKHVVKVDTLQMVHTLHNLAEALEKHGAGIPHTLRDSTLREEAHALEEYYLKKSEEQVNLAKAQTMKLTEIVEEIAQGRPLGYSTWWEDLLNEIRDDGDLLSRIITYLDDNKIPGQICLSLRIKNLPAAMRIVAIWLADTDVAREEAMQSLGELHNTPKEVLSYAAINCHLTNKKKQKNKKTCQICLSNNLLKKYESLIFAIIEQEEEDEELYESDNENDVNKRNKASEVSHLRNVEFYEVKKEGNWKPSPQEGIIRILASFVKAKRLCDDWIQDSTKHLLLLEAVRKEFKSLRAEWQKISNLVAAKDEISMAKLRLRLPTEFELGEGSSTTAPRKQLEVINVLQPHEIPFHKTMLESELNSGLLDLKRTAGILLYLKNLQENGHIENEPCPVCRDKLDEKWSVLRCGHCLCFECIPLLLRTGSFIEVECPMCRLKTPKSEVSYVVANSSSDGGDTGDHKLVGSFSTKVEAITLQLLKLRSSDPDVKVIIFSTWEKVLDVISEALKVNSISFRRLGSLSRHQNGLTQFKTGPVTALLIPLSRGSKGLNIIEATHVFLVEPILNPADELQAVGRVHRIGQTKATFVHRFIIHNTVEEKMAISVDPDGWSDGNVTFAELFNLFKMETPVQPTPNPVVIVNLLKVGQHTSLFFMGKFEQLQVPTCIMC